MSKASQYAETIAKLRNRPKFEVMISDGEFTDNTMVAYVNDYGFLTLTDDELNPEQALKLAAWIIDQFGEET